MSSTGTTSPRASIVEPKPGQNLLLSLLKPDTAARIYPDLQLVPLALGQVLYEPGDTMKSVFFPVDSIVSLLYVMESGASAEISVVGKEGMAGISLFMGGASTPSRAVVQSAGHAYQLNSALPMTEAAGKLQKLGVIKYMRGRITVLDRAKLEELSCECYQVVKTETDRLFESLRR
jgi:hypothetical protein